MVIGDDVTLVKRLFAQVMVVLVIVAGGRITSSPGDELTSVEVMVVVLVVIGDGY